MEDGGHRVLAACETPEEATRFLHRPPQLVLCDIFFEGKARGLDFGALLDRRRIPYFLITGKAGEDIVDHMRGYHPLGLIYKPLDARDILTRIELRFGQPSARARRYLTVNHRGRKQLIPYHDVIYLEADGNYCYLHTTAGTRFPILRSLQSLLEEFATLNFTRVHRSHAVNPARVRSYTATEVRLEGETVLPIGRRYREEFLRWIRQY